MSAAPRFSTADIAKTAEQRAREERTEVTPVPPERGHLLEPEARDTREAREVREAEAVTATPIPDAAVRGNEVREVRELPEDSGAPLFASEAAEDFRHRWDTVQASFVDDPRRAVEQADALVAETMTRLAETFASERSRLEERFAQGSNLSTEDLRVALRHYRSFFKRLLSV